jgi:hypothetical protein
LPDSSVIPVIVGVVLAFTNRMRTVSRGLGDRQEVGSPADLLNKKRLFFWHHTLLLLLSGMQRPKLQEIKIRASIHLPLDGFEPVDMALDRPTTPRILQSGCYRRILLTQAHGKTTYFRRRTSFCLRYLGWELRVASPFHESPKSDGYCPRLADLWT